MGRLDLPERASANVTVERSFLHELYREIDRLKLALAEVDAERRRQAREWNGVERRKTG